MTELDIAAQHALAVTTEMAIPHWVYRGEEVMRHTGRHAKPEATPQWQHPCLDGKSILALPLYIDDRRFAALREWMEEEGFDHGLSDPIFDLSETREDHMFEVVDAIRRFVATRHSGWVFIEAQKRKLPWAPVNTPFECADDRHFREFRSAFEEVTVGVDHYTRARLPFLIQGVQPDKE